MGSATPALCSRHPLPAVSQVPRGQRERLAARAHARARARAHSEPGCRAARGKYEVEAGHVGHSVGMGSPSLHPSKSQGGFGASARRGHRHSPGCGSAQALGPAHGALRSPPPPSTRSPSAEAQEPGGGAACPPPARGPRPTPELLARGRTFWGVSLPDPWLLGSRAWVAPQPLPPQHPQSPRPGSSNLPQSRQPPVARQESGQHIPWRRGRGLPEPRCRPRAGPAGQRGLGRRTAQLRAAAGGEGTFPSSPGDGSRSMQPPPPLSHPEPAWNPRQPHPWHGAPATEGAGGRAVTSTATRGSPKGPSRRAVPVPSVGGTRSCLPAPPPAPACPAGERARRPRAPRAHR